MKSMLFKEMKFLILVVPMLFAISVGITPIAFAEGIDLDGVVEEPEWTWLFNDISDEPYFDLYWYIDTENLYIAIATDDANENYDVMKFAFAAKDLDYRIQVAPGVYTAYRKSGGDIEDYWSTLRIGLPSGVNVSYGKTDGKRSYEISIQLEMLGNKANDFPENFKMWIMLKDGTQDSINYYPNSRAGWWFLFGSEEEGEENPTLHFGVPELPFGTLMALISTIAALTLFASRQQILLKK